MAKEIIDRLSDPHRYGSERVAIRLWDRTRMQ